MKLGELWTAVLTGDNGKPRPALILQSDRLRYHPNIIICPLSGSLRDFDFRLVIEPTAGNGLSKPSQVMIDRIIGVPRTRLRARIGRLESWQLNVVQNALLLITGIKPAKTDEFHFGS